MARYYGIYALFLYVKIIVGTYGQAKICTLVQVYLIIYCGSNIATDMAAAHPEAKTATFDRAL